MSANLDERHPMESDTSHAAARRWSIWRKVRWTLPALLLMIPVVGMQVSDDWNWSPMDFVVMGTILYSAVLAYEFVARKALNTPYRAAVGVAVVTAVLLLWVNGAVGIIGDGPVNLMFVGIPVIGVAGAFIANLESRGMARVLCVMALTQMMIPVIALLIWNPSFSPGVLPVFVLNGIFAGLWLTSAGLFWRGTRKPLGTAPA